MGQGELVSQEVVAVAPPPEYDVLTVTLFSNKKMWLAAWNLGPHYENRNVNLQLAKAVKARLYGHVRLMGSYYAQGVSVAVNDLELDSTSGGPQTWSFDFPDVLGYLYDGMNTFTFVLFRVAGGGLMHSFEYYGTMSIDIYYPKGEAPPPPPPPTGCFIATAAYGSALAPQLSVLRRFRDLCLPLSLTRFYYWVSPPLARGIARCERLRRLVRCLLKLPLCILNR